MLRACLFGLMIALIPPAAMAEDPLIVHEWGTFTALQDEQGRALGRINTDDEPVPSFVHELAGTVMFPPTAAFTSLEKGAPAGDPNITMRLETPVLYFHLAPGATHPLKVDVEVGFRGGWLSQFFPEAQAEVEGAKPNEPLPPLGPDTLGRLAWKGLLLNSTSGTPPTTSDPVWTAPRAIDSTPISAGAEREQFLFYRGVGHLDAPLHISRHGQSLQLHSDATALSGLLLVDARPDGTLAFRPLDAMSQNSERSTPAAFEERDYSTGNLRKLRQALKSGLMNEGLFQDEADALLNTWERSYFRNPGTRVFFLLPQQWTDEILPLKLSVRAQVTRVMVGRIELVTPLQRQLLARMSAASADDAKAARPAVAAMSALRQDASRAGIYHALAGGQGNVEDLGVPAPQIYRDYLALGRFRSALLLEKPQGGLNELAQVLTP